MTTKEAINILYTEATQENQTYSLDEVNQAKNQLEKEFKNYDPVEDARAYCLYSFFKEKPLFIKLGCCSTNLKQIREYSIQCNRLRGQLPDRTMKCDEMWELSIWLYGENTYHSIGCVNYKEAEEMKEKLDNILGVVDLEKEK